MNSTKRIHGTKIGLMILSHLLASFLLTATAAQVTLTWDANSPEPDGYRLYQRQAGEQNFTEIWSGTDIIRTIDGLVEGTTYYFVVRAFEESVESDNSNQVEYTPASTPPNDNDPAGAGNTAPNKPELEAPANAASRVGLTPTLVTGSFSDADADAHARTCYQISTNADFSGLVFKKTSAEHLTRIKVPNLILEPDTTYYWRAKFYDDLDGGSSWSEPSEFTTIDYETAGDVNGDGILDTQQIESETDIDQNGVADSDQAGFQGIKTADPNNPYVAVSRMNETVQIGSVLALDSEQLPHATNRPDQLTNVISFKLYLQDDTTSATVTVHFSEPAPSDALWYKYDLDDGWDAYSQAVFSNDRKSVSLVLEDGGIGDQDGVKNGIIVDPAGLGYTRPTNAWGSGSSGCFIIGASNESYSTFLVAKILLILAGICFIPVLKVHRSKR